MPACFGFPLIFMTPAFYTMHPNAKINIYDRPISFDTVILNCHGIFDLRAETFVEFYRSYANRINDYFWVC